jgi:hypothetical protein
VHVEELADGDICLLVHAWYAAEMLVMVVGGMLGARSNLRSTALPSSVVRSRGHGRRRRLVAIAAVVLLVALHPGGDADPGEADAGREPDGRHSGAEPAVLHRVVGFDALRPSSLGGLVTGLKGSPLEEELALAAKRRLHVRRLLRHVEQVAASAPAAWVGHGPRHHALALRLLAPHGAAAKRVAGGAGEERLLRRAIAAVGFRPVLLLVEHGVWERLQRQPELLAVAAGARQEVGRVALEAHGRRLRRRRGRRRLAAATRASHGKERLDRVRDGVRVERRREEARGAAACSTGAGEVERSVRGDGDGLRLVVGVLGGVGVRRGGRRRGGIGRGLPRGQRLELVDGVLGVLDEPVDGLAGAVVAQPVLHVVELDGGVRREAHAPVPRPARRAHLAVAVLAPRGAHNVPSLHGHDLPGAAPRARVRRGRGGRGLAARAHPSYPRPRGVRRRGRLRRELVHVVLADSSEGQELRLEAVVVVVGVGLAGVAHGVEKGILGRQAAPLPHGRRGLQVLELKEGDRRRVLVLLHLLVELQQPVVVVPLLLICFLLRSSASSSFSAAACVAAVRSPVVVPRIQIPRLVARRYCCSASDKARPSNSPAPITRTTRNTEKKTVKRVEKKAAVAAWRWTSGEVVARDGWTDTDPGGEARRGVGETN